MTNEELKTQNEKLIKDNKVVLYMKGNPEQPQCGFSARALQALTAAGMPIEEIKTVDILHDPATKQAVGDINDYRLFPQCFIKGEFVGGSDILVQMYEDGNLAKTLEG